MPNIDIHCHTTPSGAWAELRRVAESSSRFAAAARAVVERPEVCGDPQMTGALDERIALLDAGQIDTEIVSSTLVTSKFFDSVEFATDVSRSINDELSEASQRYGRRYRFFANLPLPYVAASVDELRRAARLPGFTGIVVSEDIGPTFDDPSLVDLYAELSSMRALVFLHPGRMESPGRFGRLGMETMLGWPTQTTLSVMELILGGVLDRFPGITVITPHLSGTILYLLARIDHTYQNLPLSKRGSQEAPSWYVKRMYHDTVNNQHPALNMARDIVGVEHIVLGSDFPWLSRQYTGECVDLVNGLDWPEEELALVRGGNVERLLRERDLA